MISDCGHLESMLLNLTCTRMLHPRLCDVFSKAPCLTQINRICGREYRPKDLPIRKLSQTAGVTWPDPLPCTSPSSCECGNDTEDEEQFESEEEETEDEELPVTGSRMFKFQNANSKSLVGYPDKFVLYHLSGRENVEPPPLQPPRVEVPATSCTPRRDTTTLEDSTSTSSVASMVRAQRQCEY